MGKTNLGMHYSYEMPGYILVITKNVLSFSTQYSVQEPNFHSIITVNKHLQNILLSQPHFPDHTER